MVYCTSLAGYLLERDRIRAARADAAAGKPGEAHLVPATDVRSDAGARRRRPARGVTMRYRCRLDGLHAGRAGRDWRGS